MNTLRIATRKSPLALWQAEHVKAELEKHWPNLTVELVPMSTKGDEVLDRSLAKIGGKGLFIKELEIAMQAGEADIAVHSMKDVPATMPAGFALPIIMEREDPRDALIGGTLDSLPQGALVGTSSLRRQMQILALRPDLKITSIRGNVGTRLGKVGPEVDATLLAYAGLKRLGLLEKVDQAFSTDEFIPSAGQGAIGIEIRAGDQTTAALLQPLHHQATADCVIAERAVTATLEADCSAPLAAFAVLDGEQITLRAAIGDASELLKTEVTGLVANAEAIGQQAGQSLLDQGAARFLSDQA